MMCDARARLGPSTALGVKKVAATSGSVGLRSPEYRS